jgi:hypothetical protein
LVFGVEAYQNDDRNILIIVRLLHNPRGQSRRGPPAGTLRPDAGTAHAGCAAPSRHAAIETHSARHRLFRRSPLIAILKAEGFTVINPETI